MEAAIERRDPKQVRVPLDDLLVELHHDGLGEAFEADGINLARGGLSLRSAVLPDVGSKLRCAFRSPLSGERISTEAEVVWSQGRRSEVGEFGLRFTDVDADDQDIIEEVVQAWRSALSGGQPERLQVRLDGVGQAIDAEVVHRSGDALVLEQALPFLRIGTGVETAAGRRGELQAVDLRLEGETPRLVLTIWYSDEAKEEARVSSDETLLDTDDAPLAVSAESTAAEGVTIAAKSVRGMNARGGSLGSTFDVDARAMAALAKAETGPLEVEIRGAEEPEDEESLAAETETEAPEALDVADSEDAEVKSLRGPKAVAKRESRKVEEKPTGAEEAPLALAKAGALGLKLQGALAVLRTKAAPLGAKFRHGLVALRVRLVPAFRRLLLKLKGGAAALRQRLPERFRKADAPAKRKQQPARARVQGKTAKRRQRKQGTRKQEAGRGSSVPESPKRRKVGRYVLLALVIAAGSIAAAVRGAGPEAEAEVAALPESASPAQAQEVSQTPEPVAAPAAQPQAAAEEPVAVDLHPPAMPEPERRAGRMPAPEFTSLDDAARPGAPGTVPSDSPYAVVRDSAAPAPAVALEAFGAASVPNARVYELRLSAPPQGLRGEARSDGFDVHLEGTRAIDGAGSIARELSGIRRARIRTEGNVATLQLRYVSSPGAYRVSVQGTTLKIEIAP